MQYCKIGYHRCDKYFLSTCIRYLVVHCASCTHIIITPAKIANIPATMSNPNAAERLGLPVTVPTVTVSVVAYITAPIMYSRPRKIKHV